MPVEGLALPFRLLEDGTGSWASFRPLIGAWSDERRSLAVGADGPGTRLVATARPTAADAVDAPTGPGVFALRWFDCPSADAEEFVELSAAAWPAFEQGTPGTRVFGLFRAGEPVGDATRFLLCTRYPNLAAWASSRFDTGTAEFRRRAELTRRTQVGVWRLA